MSSDCLENESAAAVARPSAQRLLLLLKSRGTADRVRSGRGARDHRRSGARQQLAKLAQEGLVQAASESRGVGRPSQVWTITAKGTPSFPDSSTNSRCSSSRPCGRRWGIALEQLIAARERKMRETLSAGFARGHATQDADRAARRPPQS